ncbi:MAG TPA: FtsX-like permease family protein, partial [Acidimicrobiales bacterium]|nr:FtsX-like permease family protein [Acidimicrobiales bacterium]
MGAALLTLRFRRAGHWSVWATIAVAVATVTSLVAGSALFLGAVGPASADLQIAARCAPTTGLIVKADLHPEDVGRLGARHAAVAAVAPGRLQPPRRLLTFAAEGRPAAGTAGVAEPVTLAAKQGALDHLRVVQGEARSDAALVPRSAADRLGLGPGGRLRVRLGTAEADLPVGGVYDDLRLPLEPYWCYQRPLLLPPDDFSLVTPPAFVVVPERLILALVREQGLVAEATWEAPLAVPTPSLAALRATAASVAGFRDSAPDAGPFAVEEFAHPVQIVTDLPFVAMRATAVRDDVRRVVLPLAVATAVAATLMVALVGALWVDRHQKEVALLEALGSSRAAVVVRALAEVLPAAVLGAGLGVLLALVVVDAAGPRSVGAREAGPVAPLAGVALAGACA